MAPETDPGDPLKAAEEAHLVGLEGRFLDALERVRAGQLDAAADDLRAILRAEPRLAEPRIELARLLLTTGQFEEAAEQAEEAVRLVEAGGRWTEELTDDQLLSLALGLHGEALRQLADQDEVVFGDPERWQALVQQAREQFRRAARLDPENQHAAWWAGGTDTRPDDEPEDEEAELDGNPLEMRLKWPAED